VEDREICQKSEKGKKRPEHSLTPKERPGPKNVVQNSVVQISLFTKGRRPIGKCKMV